MLDFSNWDFNAWIVFAAACICILYFLVFKEEIDGWLNNNVNYLTGAKALNELYPSEWVYFEEERCLVRRDKDKFQIACVSDGEKCVRGTREEMSNLVGKPDSETKPLTCVKKCNQVCKKANRFLCLL